MSPLLAPLFAQLVSLQLADRTEGRYVSLNGDKRYEGATSPIVGLNVSTKRTGFQLIYSPSLVLTPLDHEPRTLYLFHQVGASASYVVRRTTFTLTSTLGIGSLNLRLLGVQGLQPPLTGGTPTTGTPTGQGGVFQNVPPSDQKVRFYLSTTSLSVGHRLTRRAQLTAIASSTTASGLDNASRRFYPTQQGWTLGGTATYTYPLSKHDAVASNASLVKTWSSTANESAILNATLGYTHSFSPRTTGSASGGLSITRFSDRSGLAGFSVFPTATVAASHIQPIGRGGLSFAIGAYSSPALDPLRALVDPRVGVNASIGYTRKKLFVTTTGFAALSVAPAGNNQGAVNAVQGEARAGYQMTKLASIDTGARITRQTYGGATIVPTSWAVFVGLTLGYTKILAGGR